MRTISLTKTYFAASLRLLMLLFVGIRAIAQPVANFGSSLVSGCAPIIVQFNDNSTGQPSQWRWDLGNGTTSFLQHPSVTYIQPGTYSVKLVVKNALGSDSITRTNYITVYAAPAVNFTATQTTACFVVNAGFTPQSVTGITRWQWDFGDGLLSSEQQPVHRYTQTGTYNVTLKLTNSDGCVGTMVKPGYITVNGVKAGFAANVSAGCNTQRYVFTNNSTGTGQLQYRWYFGNGDSSNAASPVYTYPQSGNYTVRLIVQNQFGCVDSIRRIVTVNGVANADFTADVTRACRAPLTVRFSVNTSVGSTYLWDFGDKIISTQPNPVHVYTDTGAYTVKLKVRNATGCIDSVTKVGFIKISRPIVASLNLPDSGCVGLRKEFEVLLANTVPGLRYSWNFGDGNTASTANPAHRYNTEGDFPVSLILEDAAGCRDTTVVEKAIRINSKPRANFSVSNTVTCAGTEVTFTDLSTGNPTAWEWEFGDNTQSTEQHPRHRFADTGFLSPRLVAFNVGCSDTFQRTRYVYARPSVTKFKFDFSCADPYTFSFTNNSIGASSLLWDFGDGTTSTAVNPVHRYRDTGLYEVALTTFNQATGCVYYRSRKAKVVKLVPNFYASDSVICRGASVNFTSSISTNEAGRFIWDFGDGETQGAYSNSISHVYERAGNYTVSLTVINLVNCRDSFTRIHYIRVNGPAASFAPAAAIGCANTATFFNDSSTAPPLAPIMRWQWDFGDGSRDTFSAPPFSHVYSNRGSYRVALSIVDANGCTDSFRLATPVVIQKVNPLIISSDTVVCLGKVISLTAPYNEPGIRYRWTLGDGNTSNAQTVRHVYANEGFYTVKLVSTNLAGCSDSAVYTDFIKVIEPRVAFSMSDSFKTCPPLIVQFTNESVNAADVLWDFGDGTSTSMYSPSHFYPTAGSYTVTLTIKGRGGCVKQMKKEIVVLGPKGTITYGPLNLCNPGPVQLQAQTIDAVSFIWDFNDGTTAVSTDSVNVHPYDNPGNYVPRLLLIDANGCRVPVSGADTIRVGRLNAAFSKPAVPVCDNDSVRLVNVSVSTTPITAANWQWGDGATANGLQQAMHQYATGTYLPSLIVTNASGCTDSTKAVAPIQIIAAPSIGMQVSGDGCVPLTVNLEAQSTGNVAVNSWQWSIGDRLNFTGQQPAPQVLSTAGTYMVQLIATASNGCQQLVQRSLDAWPVPNVHIAGVNTICSGNSTVLTAAGAAAYAWSSAGTGLSCIACSSTTVQPQVNTTYVVTGSSEKGCTAKDSLLVKVVQPFRMTAANKAICTGSSTSLEAYGAATYQWSQKDGSGTLPGATPVVQPDTTTSYRVIGQDGNGCFADTAYATVTVNQLPLVNAGDDKQVAAGVSVDLVPLLSPDVVEARWTPTDGLFRNTGNAISVKPEVSTEYTLKVKNAAGCTAEDKAWVRVTNEADKIFLPNTFSPNNDGVNDVFYPRSKVLLKVLRFRVLDREGLTVFERSNFYTNDATSGWDGKRNGIPMRSDAYIYAVHAINTDGSPIFLTGNVAIIQ